MRIVAIANGGFAVPSLRAIKESRHELVAIFVMPLRTRRSGEKAGEPPVRSALGGFLSGIPVFEFDNINSSEGVEALRSLNADIFFICDYGKILSVDALRSTKIGGVNLHGSLLPKYRGAAPINRAIQAGEREIGASVIFIEPEVDSGPIVATVSYRPSLEETAVEIEAKLAEMGASAVLDAFDKIESGTVSPLSQDPSLATSAPKLRKEEGLIDWRLSSTAIIDLYRAFQPWPRVYSNRTASTGASVRLIMGPFSEFDEQGNKPFFDDDAYEKARFGEVVATTKTSFWIKTGTGALRVLSVQPAGKKNMTAEAFLRGYRVQIGDSFQ